LDKQNITSRTVTMNSTTPRKTNPTILRVDEFCFLDDEMLSRVVGPSEEFEGVLDGGAEEDGGGGDGSRFGLVGDGVGGPVGDGLGAGLVGVGVGAGPPGVDGGDAEGAILVLNGFPSFLKFGMLCNFGGTGPENKLFSIFKSLRGRSCKTLRVPDNRLPCMCNVVKDDRFFIDGGNTPVKLLEEISKFTSPVSEPKASGSCPFSWLSLSDLGKQGK
jgi:hypothetical protein